MKRTTVGLTAVLLAAAISNAHAQQASPAAADSALNASSMAAQANNETDAIANADKATRIRAGGGAIQRSAGSGCWTVSIDPT